MAVLPDYSPGVARRFANPVHAAPLPPGPGRLIRGAAGSPEEGARVEFEARVLTGPDGAGRLVAVTFRAFGCPHTIAACSLAADWLTGRPAADLGQVEPAWLAAALDVPPEKAGRLLIIQDALRNCLADWDNSRLPGTP